MKSADVLCAKKPPTPHPDDAFTGVVHPYADRWPMRPADEIEDMAASITANGQRFPIILAADGTLVDGRNRLRACELAGVKPWFQVYDELYDDMVTLNDTQVDMLGPLNVELLRRTDYVEVPR